MDAYRSAMVGASGDVRAYEVAPGAGAIVVAIAVVALLGLWWLWRGTAPKSVEPGPPGMDLTAETPALVDLLTGGFEVDDDAVPATVVDLAARGWYTIEDQGNQVIIRTRQRRPVNDRLTAYEQRVLDHIERHAKSGVVPTPVLTLGPSGVSKRWVKGFTRDVVQHGQLLGLCRRRWDLIHMAYAWGFVAMVAVPIYVAGRTAEPTSDTHGWVTLGNLLVAVATLIGVAVLYGAIRVVSFSAQTDTPAGRSAAAHWLGVRLFYRDTGEFEAKPASSVAIWDRHLAYATAMGLAPTVQRQIPFETEHNRHAWSHETGDWRRVTVRYRSFRPGRGRHPLMAVFSGLVTAAIFGVLAAAGFWLATADASVTEQFDKAAIDISAEARRWIGLGGLAGAVLFGTIALTGVAQFLLGAGDVFRRRSIEGTLIRKREFGGGEDSEPKRYLAVDDGSDDDVLAFKVDLDTYVLAGQNARVAMTYSPWLGYVSDVTVIEPAPVIDGEAGTFESIEAALTTATTRFAEMMMAKGGAQMTALSDATGPDGRPILDQVGPDGTTLRSQLSNSRSQIEALQHDPRLANTPVRGLLDMLLDHGMLGGGAVADHHPHREPPPPPTPG